ncbi:CapA family protein [Desulfofalx alkaliphila]|uniref:CapA family protein n=1 Tax=Desulfofalx alkaliphila TaxID=105483 RepID=UPI0006922723|nr:CapA family protein [Desulfofalx alkaliphila]
MRARIVLILGLLLLHNLLLAGCSSQEQAPQTPHAPPPPPKPEPVVIEIAAVGDFLMHMPVINAAWNDEIDNYDFASQLRDVRKFLEEPDLTIANLETRLAGRDNGGYSGYPLFNCPEQLAYDMKKVGIDVVTTANNHSLDRGFAGLVTTLNHLEEAGLHAVGNYRTPEERQPLVVEVQGISLGILNYTESTNGIPIPQGKEYAIDMIDLDLIAADLATLKELEVDVILVCLHFGEEYQRHPNNRQRELIDNIFDLGADLIFGNHPHVIQPMEKRTVNRHGEEEVFVIYSLGNFISNQDWQYSDSGIILNVKLEKDLEENKTRILEVDYVPTWVHKYYQNGKYHYRVVPVEKAIKDYEQQCDNTINADHYRRLKEVWQETTSHLTVEEQNIYPRPVH